MTTHREFTRADKCLRAAVATVCAYEAVAITTHRVPTVSRLVRRYPAIEPVVLAALAIHFRPTDQTRGG